MTLEESAALAQDLVFRGRVKMSCIKYADFIQIEAVTTPAHNTRFKWAQNTKTQPDLVAMQVHPIVVMDAAVQAAGAQISDAAWQAAVETTVDKML